jgi:L-iditol 2-dehydrogenase
MMNPARPDSCRAAVLVEPGRPVEIREIPLPTVLEPGAVLVRTLATTVCATDVHMCDGSWQSRPGNANLPGVVGHEMVGEVVAFGDGPARDSVGQDLAVGDRVVWTHGFCGRCRQCVVEHEPTLCTDRRGYMTEPYTSYPHLTGAFSEYGYVFPTSGRIRVPDAISDVAASASSCALRTVMHAFGRLGDVEGRTVGIQGSGPLGLFAVARATAAGADAVISIGAPDERLELARRWGATATVDVRSATTAASRIDQVRELTGGAGVDVLIEVSGARGVFAEGIEMLAPGGRYAVVGTISPDPQSVDASRLVHRQLTVLGSLSGSAEDYFAALRFMAAYADRFDWDAMISSRHRLEDVNKALELMASQRAIKPAIEYA